MSDMHGAGAFTVKCDAIRLRSESWLIPRYVQFAIAIYPSDHVEQGGSWAMERVTHHVTRTMARLPAHSSDMTGPPQSDTGVLVYQLCCEDTP